MNSTRQKIVLALCILTLCWIVPLRGQAMQQKNVYTIAVVKDGPSQYADELTQLIERELQILTEDEFKVVFINKPLFSADWKPEQYSKALKNALHDPKVDIVLTIGVLVAEKAAQKDLVLNKPVINAFVEDADILELPYSKEGHSTKKNYNFVVVPDRLIRDLKKFNELVNIKNIAIVVDSLILDNAKNLRKEAEHLEREMGIKVTFIPVNTMAKEVVNKLDDTIDATYLTPALRMSPEEWQKVIDGINGKKLPTFSSAGHHDVELGVLAGLTPPINKHRARRVALNILRVIEGTPAEELTVHMNVDKMLMINARTARQIGYSPPFDITTQAKLLYEEELRMGEPLTIEKAVQIALENNIDFAIKKSEVQVSRYERNEAFSNLLPQINANSQYSRIDSDRARATMGGQAEQKATVGIKASQMIFNDGFISQFRAAGHLYESLVDEKLATRLDTIDGTTKSYLQYLQAMTLLRIESDNLNLTRSNLELAKVRYEVGTAGREEVYRWEAQEAFQKSSLNKAASTVDQARTTLNQIMGIDQDVQWDPRNIELANDDSYFLDNRLKDLLSNEKHLRVFEKFIVQYAIGQSPFLMALDKKIEAREIKYKQSKRRFVLPNFSASFSYDHIAHDKFLGGSSSAIRGSHADNNEWIVGLGASIPLFEGTGRYQRVKRTLSELIQLKRQREQFRQVLERRTRDALYAIKFSFPNIRLQRVTADRALKNLDLVKEKYASGTINIIDLLDAQNQSFVANQDAAVAAYRYLTDLFEMQRAISWFELEKSEQGKKRFLSKFTAFMKNENLKR